MATWHQLGSGTRQAISRAIDQSGEASVLVQNLMDRVVQQNTLREQGIFSTLPHRPGAGSQAIHNRRAATSTLAEWLADTDTPTEYTGTYSAATFNYRTCLKRGRVTRKMEAMGKPLYDLLFEEIEATTDDYRQELENSAVVGDNGANANRINGLLTLIGTTATQVIANSTATLGAALSLTKFNKTLDAIKGAGNARNLRIYVNFQGGRLLDAALQTQAQYQGGSTMLEIDGGFTVASYKGAPIVKTTGIPDDLAWSGSALTAFSGGATTAIIVCNVMYTEWSDLTPTKLEMVGTTTSQHFDFEIYCDTAMVLKNPRGAAFLGGLLGS